MAISNHGRCLFQKCGALIWIAWANLMPPISAQISCSLKANVPNWISERIISWIISICLLWKHSDFIASFYSSVILISRGWDSIVKSIQYSLYVTPDLTLRVCNDRNWRPPHDSRAITPCVSANCSDNRKSRCCFLVSEILLIALLYLWTPDSVSMKNTLIVSLEIESRARSMKVD